MKSQIKTQKQNCDYCKAPDLHNAKWNYTSIGVL